MSSPRTALANGPIWTTGPFAVSKSGESDMTEATPQSNEDRLGLVHENQAMRNSNRHLVAALEAMLTEPGRETLERVDQILRRAGLANLRTATAVSRLVEQRDEARKFLHKAQPFLARLVLLGDPDSIEGQIDRTTITLEAIIKEAERLMAE